MKTLPFPQRNLVSYSDNLLGHWSHPSANQHIITKSWGERKRKIILIIYSLKTVFNPGEQQASTQSESEVPNRCVPGSQPQESIGRQNLTAWGHWKNRHERMCVHVYTCLRACMCTCDFPCCMSPTQSLRQLGDKCGKSHCGLSWYIPHNT